MNSTTFYGISALFNGLFGLFLVYTVYLRNRKNPLNRSFLFFGIAVSGWSLIYALWCWAENPRVAEFYIRHHMMFAALIPATLFHFCCMFTQMDQKLKKWIWTAYGLGAVYSVLMLTPLMIVGVREIMFFKYWPKGGPLLSSHVIYFTIVDLASLFFARSIFF